MRHYATIPEWEDLVQDLGPKVVAMSERNDYQGDYFVLLRDGNDWGWLVIGYGSCSGCDELEGEWYSALYHDHDHDKSPSEAMNDLVERLRREVRWGTAQEIETYLRDAAFYPQNWWASDAANFIYTVAMPALRGVD